MKKIILILSILLIATLGCKSKLKTRELGAYTYKTSCVGEQNGKLLVNAWGRGTSYDECKNEALKNAIKDVVFKGIQDGNIACKKPAILGKTTAENEYQRFFESFLSENGEYRMYAELYDEARSQSRSKKIRKSDRVLNMALEFQVLIDRNGLIKLLQQPNLAK